MDRALFQDRRVWLGGAALVTLIIVAATWFLLISPKRDSVASLHQQRDEATVQNDSVSGRNAKLAGDYRNLDGLKSSLRQAIAGLPSDSGLPAFTRQVAATATATHVTVTSIAVTAPVSVTPAAPAAPSSGTGSSAAPSSTPTVVTNQASATGPVAISATLLSSGTPTQQTAFLTALQNGQRRLLVTSSQLSFAHSSLPNAATSMTTQVTLYSEPMTAAQKASLKAALAAK